MDENLNWKSEISYVANKVAKSIGIISLCSFFLLKLSLSMLYYFFNLSLLLPLQYSLGFDLSNLRRLVILQKCIIRIINKSRFNAHTDSIYKDLGILKCYDIYLLQLGQFMHSCKNSLLPPRFNNNFSQSNQFHSYNTKIPRPTVYRFVVQRLRSSRLFFQGLIFLIHLTTRSSTLNPFPL